MIPIRDTIPSKSYPIVNHVIIGINVALYLVEMSQGPNLERFIYIYGLVPARYSVPQFSAYFTTAQQVLSVFSFMDKINKSLAPCKIPSEITSM